MTVSFVGDDTVMPVRGTDGRYHVVYELILTNTKPVPASLDAVDVLDAANGTKLLGLKDKDLIDNLRTLDVQPLKGASLPPNESRLLYITVIFDSKAAIPDALDHRIEVEGADNPGATKPSSLSYKAGHLTLQSVNGKLYNSQRFAVDFMRLDSDGRLVKGDTSKNSNFVDYGAPIVATVSTASTRTCRREASRSRSGTKSRPATSSVSSATRAIAPRRTCTSKL